MKKKVFGPTPLTPYSVEVETFMKQTYESLSEKDRRFYAGIEAIKLGRGGITYIAKLFGCSRNTIKDGIAEQKNPESIVKNRCRNIGGGRKSSLETITNIDDVFLEVIDDHIAGDPMEEKIRWTNLSLKDISLKMKEKGINISVTVVRKLLKKHGFRRRKAMKKKSIGVSKNRNEQFGKIAELKQQYQKEGNPVISVDTKKKEFIGNLYREGDTYCEKAMEVFDHDFPNLAEGIAIPHAIYDLTLNEAVINIGMSKDTSEFACDSIKIWWEQVGKLEYAGCTSILMLADGGGSNSSRHYIFKEDLQKLVNEIGIEIRVAHYPPYTSKWNPVEHRVFPHVTRSLRGVIVRSYEMFKKFVEKATTETGLVVKANFIHKVYETGRKYAKDFKENMTIKFDEYLGLWNYTVAPQNH